MTRMIYCQKLHKEAPGLEEPPFPNALGERVFQHISQEAWELWLSQQTMLINEYRLNLLDRQAQQFLQAELEKFLFKEA